MKSQAGTSRTLRCRPPLAGAEILGLGGQVNATA